MTPTNNQFYHLKPHSSDDKTPSSPPRNNQKHQLQQTVDNIQTFNPYTQLASTSSAPHHPANQFHPLPATISQTYGLPKPTKRQKTEHDQRSDSPIPHLQSIRRPESTYPHQSKQFYYLPGTNHTDSEKKQRLISLTNPVRQEETISSNPSHGRAMHPMSYTNSTQPHSSNRSSSNTQTRTSSNFHQLPKSHQ